MKATPQGECEPAPEAEAKPLPSRRAIDPLHGVTLQMVLERLVERYGWQDLAERIAIRCFESDPSVKSSLVFLRRTPWAREKVEKLYLRAFHSKPRRPAASSKPSAVDNPKGTSDSKPARRDSPREPGPSSVRMPGRRKKRV